MSLFDDWRAKERRIAERMERTIADHLAAGRSVYHGEGGEIVREDPDRRRFVVRLVGDDFEVVREIDSK